MLNRSRWGGLCHPTYQYNNAKEVAPDKDGVRHEKNVELGIKSYLHLAPDNNSYPIPIAPLQ